MRRLRQRETEREIKIQSEMNIEVLDVTNKFRYVSHIKTVLIQFITNIPCRKLKNHFTKTSEQ